MIVSKRIKAFLRKYKPKHHWHIDSLRAYDTFNALTKHFEVEPMCFDALPAKSIESDYFKKLDLINKSRELKSKIYLDKIPFSDFKFFEKVIPSLPKTRNCKSVTARPYAMRSSLR
jgi:2-succinyl-5-enolpyruvyl-6-hydroxy-3-cyclohexene-1-carboxylate synthase